jgi:hypothetical protein
LLTRPDQPRASPKYVTIPPREETAMNWSNKNAAEQPEQSRAREVRFIQVEGARKFQEEIQDGKEIQDVMKVETRSKMIYTSGQKNRRDDTSEEEGSIEEDSSSSDLKKKPCDCAIQLLTVRISYPHSCYHNCHYC